MEKEKVVVKSGTSLGTLIFVVLIILKLTETITMNWFWVLTSFIWAPILATIAGFIVMFGVIFIIGVVGIIIAAFVS